MRITKFGHACVRIQAVGGGGGGVVVREVAAPTSLGIHDRVYSEIGIQMVAQHMANLLPASQAFELREAGRDL